MFANRFHFRRFSNNRKIRKSLRARSVDDSITPNGSDAHTGERAVGGMGHGVNTQHDDSLNSLCRGVPPLSFLKI